ncbi:signal peptidase I [Leptospira yasudae]|uniref:Signal peptidase I n=1 Tax=Leptospira yasudae TaxID=2202201 RepID=A0A6N4QZE7_9LEPT|nr:signal peptidase I [Leptospira yasudae]TGL78860.1 signal peptidase I [Leptospira yasudae]TGL79760.1 signal peptidase I [Leptospira yasudae]TGL84056.1 signal peptidase I [Leptospira yasudae]
MDNRTRRKGIAVVLNLFLPPFGFYYLNDRKFFWIFFIFVSFAGVLGSLLTYSSFVNGGGRFALFVLSIYILFSWGVLVVAALQSETKKLYESERRFPSPYWFLPATVIGLLFLGIVVDEFLKDRILKGKIQASSGMMPSVNVNDSFYTTELFYTKELKRGDIVAYKNPESGRQFLSRVIGLPGDTISVVDEITPDRFEVSRILINGEKIPQERSAKRVEEFQSGLSGKDRIAFVETIGGKSVPILETKNLSASSSLGSLKLKDDEFYLIGDNRDDSVDSRILGPIRGGQIAGKFLFTYFSANLNDLNGSVCETNQEMFCSLKRFYKILILGNVRWNYLGYDNPNERTVQ